MTYIDQRILACPKRNDGHDATGVFGDCLKTNVVNLFQGRYGYDELPHFVQYLDWWGAMRRWARSEGFDFNWSFPRKTFTKKLNPDHLLIASGPSPRGSFWHCILVDGNLDMVHDPHPSRDGILSIGDLIFISPKMEMNSIPYQLELTGA